MLARSSDPIVAIATAPGRGAVGILRLSGCDMKPLMRALCGRVLVPREAHYLPFLDASGGAIDRGIALWFPAPHSFTGEDVLELQAHGGMVLLRLLLARCLEAAAESTASGEGTGPAPARLPKLRVADPGEFSARAFHNGKIDLAQAEAIADLIDASTEAAARSASRSLSGDFSREIDTLRKALIALRTLVEATLDFPEEDIDFLERADARGQLDALRALLESVQQRARQGALLQSGIGVVIAGQPNAGKSSLLNALAGAELAIVSSTPGTTRDVVAQTIQIEGVPVHVADTAGLRDSQDAVEQIGIARAWDRIAKADAVLFLHDLTRIDDLAYQAADAAITRDLAARMPRSVPVLDLWNKHDAAPQAAVRPGLMLSTLTGQGVEALRQRLLEVAGGQALPDGLFLARARHVDALRRVADHLGLAQHQLAEHDPALDLLAEELRLAQNALDEITGEFAADDLLGEIFSSFCIGK